MCFSCGSDDDGGSSSNNVLIYDGTEFELKAGVIENYGDYYTDGVYNFDVSLLSSEITIGDDEITPNDDIISGVYFELFTDNSSDLEIGTYTFGSTYAVNTYDSAEIYINSTDGGYNGFEVTSGSFTVLDNGSTYEFEFAGTAEGGESFSGYYRGSLEAFDESESSNRAANTITKNKSSLFKK